jgi:lysophospholipase L1-like esterase
MMAERFAGQSWVCINRGVNEWTSADLLRNVFDIAKAYSKAFEVVICIGMNDSKPNVRTSPEMFGINMTGILRVLKVLDRHVYLCTIPDFGGFGCINYDLQSVALVARYNKVIRSAAQNSNSYLVDLSGFDPRCYADSVHLNNTGAKEMAARVMAAIIRRRGFGCEEIEQGPIE